MHAFVLEQEGKDSQSDKAEEKVKDRRKSNKIVIGDQTPVKISYRDLQQLCEDNEEIWERINRDRRKRKSRRSSSSSLDTSSSGKRTMVIVNSPPDTTVYKQALKL